MDGSVVIGVSLDTSAVSSAASALETQLSMLGNQLNQALLSPIQTFNVGEGVFSTLSGISEAIMSSSASVTAAMATLASSAISAFTSASWSGAGAGAVSAVAGGINSSSSAVASAAKSVANTASAAFSSGGWSSIGHSMMSGVASGIRAAGSEIISAIREVSAQAEGAVKDYYKIQSPSTLMRDEVGVMISRGIAEGIVSGREYVSAAFDSVYADRMRASSPTQVNDGRRLTQNIYLRDSEASPYLTAKKIKRESEALLKRS